MTQTVRKNIIKALATLALGVAATGTSVSASGYYAPANAPVTYEMTNPSMVPGYAAPQGFLSLEAGLPQVTGPAATFDRNRVDPTLYAHQKVGNPYTVMGRTYYPAHNPSYDMVGSASWYGDKFHGKLTASGETYDKNAMTAAHKTLPLNSLVVVTNMATGQSLTLRINDRGPFVGNRMIDLSEAAATALGYKTAGLGEVRVQYAGPATPAREAYVAPQPAPQAYQPLRTLPQQIQPQAALPQATLPQAPVSIPEAHADNSAAGDAVTTLTIKGPVHMASHNRTYPEARLIKAVYRTTK